MQHSAKEVAQTPLEENTQARIVIMSPESHYDFPTVFPVETGIKYVAVPPLQSKKGKRGMT